MPTTCGNRHRGHTRRGLDRARSRRACPLCARWFAPAARPFGLQPPQRGQSLFRASAAAPRRSCPGLRPVLVASCLRRGRATVEAWFNGAPAPLMAVERVCSSASLGRPARAVAAARLRRCFAVRLAWSRRLWCAWWKVAAPAPAGRPPSLNRFTTLGCTFHAFA